MYGIGHRSLREEHLKLEKEKFVAAMRTKLQAGLDAVAEAFKGSPQAMELYGKARAIDGPNARIVSALSVIRCAG